MSGGNGVIPLLPGVVQHAAEFDGSIAHHTRVGGSAPAVFLRKDIHYLPAEAVGQIQHEVLDSQCTAHRPGILNFRFPISVSYRDQTAAAQAQGAARHLIPLLHKQQRCNGAVHSSTHSHQDLFTHVSKPHSSADCGCAAYMRILSHFFRNGEARELSREIFQDFFALSCIFR